MAFNTDGFMRQQFEPRTAAIDVPSLSAWFDEGEKPAWTVRGMTANELAKALDSSSKSKNLDAVIRAIGNSKQTIEELRAVLGMSEDTPADIIKRLEQLAMCSVAPKIELNVAVKLAETFPIEFYQITNKISELTGLGMDLKK